ncbi:MAG TPA: hypothetical protein VEK57_05780 [Thermoanaerobaculia bacterium]|nr:hypothetical protein [Thermoanaerobaculia bacterium]
MKIENPKPIPSTIETVLTPEQFIEQLQTMQEQIPLFTQLRAEESRAMNGRVNVNPRFVQAAINVISKVPLVQELLGQNSDTLKNGNDELVRWAKAGDELQVTQQGIGAANRLRRQTLGLVALQTYQILRQLARSGEYSELLPYIAEMKRHLRTSRTRKPVEGDPKPVTNGLPKQ